MSIDTILTTDIWWSYIVRIVLVFILAWLLQKVMTQVLGRATALTRWASNRRWPLRHERVKTIQGLIISALTILIFAVAFLYALSLFLGTDNILWIAGLFTAAFGLGVRPLVSDLLTGVSFLFSNPFEVGEKVELLGSISASAGVLGVVEEVELLTTTIRSITGEPYTVPNGDIRIVRNFSRGRFSTADIAFTIETEDLPHAIGVLEELGKDAMSVLPNLLEPWQVISESGKMGKKIELTLAAKARFGKAADMRPRLLALVQERFQDEEVTLMD